MIIVKIVKGLLKMIKYLLYNVIEVRNYYSLIGINKVFIKIGVYMFRIVYCLFRRNF